MRTLCLAAAFCLATAPAFAAPPDDTGASLKPGAADLTGPVRGARAETTPAHAGQPAKSHRHTAKHQAKPPK